MYRGGTGIARSSSLSRASKSCVFAVNTLPMNMSANETMAYITKYSHAYAVPAKASASTENRPKNIPPKATKQYRNKSAYSTFRPAPACFFPPRRRPAPE